MFKLQDTKQQTTNELQKQSNHRQARPNQQTYLKLDESGAALVRPWYMEGEKQTNKNQLLVLLYRKWEAETEAEGKTGLYDDRGGVNNTQVWRVRQSLWRETQEECEHVKAGSGKPGKNRLSRNKSVTTPEAFFYFCLWFEIGCGCLTQIHNYNNNNSNSNVEPCSFHNGVIHSVSLW